jgi:F0F1-type ATP synthase assembly protein I
VITLSNEDEDLRRILMFVPSEQRIMEIERDLKNLRERVAKLEEDQRQKSSREEKSFRMKLALIGIIGSILSALITYILTKSGII